jgi:hypothetical protein
MVIGGNPAKPIRKRFSDGEIEMLLEMDWWDWPYEENSRSMGACRRSSHRVTHMLIALGSPLAMKRRSSISP